jgi:hypothetical protein
MIKVEKAFEDQDIVEKLLVRAEIRRAVRKEDDRIASLCEAAANEIKWLRLRVEGLTSNSEIDRTEITRLRSALDAASHVIYGDY